MAFYRTALSRWIPALVVCAVLIGACAPQASKVAESTPTAIPTPIIPTKPTYLVERGEVVRLLEFSGRLEPVVEKQLYFKTAGRIQSVLVQRGDEVEEGQILATLESGTTDVDVRRAEISLEMAKLNREIFIMQANHYSAEYPVYLKMKDYDIELAQLALDEINAKVDTAQIKAPFAGTVMTVFISPDTSVEAFKNVIVVANLSQMEVSAELTSSDLKELVEGMEVSLNAISGPGTELNGVVRRLPYPYGKASDAPQGEETQDTSTRITVMDDPATANLGMGDLVRVQAVLEKHEATLWLPPQAIRKYEGRRFVVVQDGEVQRRVDVKIGIASSDRVEILEGLEEGQIIIAP